MGSLSLSLSLYICKIYINMYIYIYTANYRSSNTGSHWAALAYLHPKSSDKHSNISKLSHVLVVTCLFSGPEEETVGLCRGASSGGEDSNITQKDCITSDGVSESKFKSLLPQPLFLPAQLPKHSSSSTFCGSDR